MAAHSATNAVHPARTGEEIRAQLLATMRVTERRLELAGIPTAILEGGEGPPVVLLHGPGEYAAKWFAIAPQLMQSHRIIAPDLPGHGISIVPKGAVAASQVLEWLGALIGQTCRHPPMLLGQILGGAIAARFAAGNNDRLSRLVLVDTLGLASFEPAPAFARALAEYGASPNDATHDGLWRHCALDLGRLQARMGSDWELIKAYNLDRAATAALWATQQSIMEQFGLPAIAVTELESITVPTTLIWGRHDRATPLAVAEAASKRHGWPLHIIEDCADDPPMEAPAEFLNVLKRVLDHR